MSAVIVEPASIGGWRVLVSGFPITPLFESRESAEAEGERLARRHQAELIVRTGDGGEIRRTSHLRMNNWR